MKLFSIFFFSTLVAFGQQNNQMNKHTINNRARQLNDSAVVLVKTSIDSMDYVNAIAILDKATAIDSNYFIAYWNKFAFQSQIKDYDKALQTAKQLNKIRPDNPDFIVSVGLLYETIGDTISSKKYFQDALVLYDKQLDRTDSKTINYNMLLMNKAVNLVLAGQHDKGNEILKQLYDSKIDNNYKDLISMFMNKSRQEIIEEYKLTNKYRH